MQVYTQVAQKLVDFYATKMKFGMIFTQTKTLDFMVELSRGIALGWSQGSECITVHNEYMQNGIRIMSGTITCPRKLQIGYNDHRWNSLYRDQGLETG